MPALSRRILETLAGGTGVGGASIGWDEEAGDFDIKVEARVAEEESRQASPEKAAE